MSTSARHHQIAGGFSRLAQAASDWNAATPVAQWRARDIVTHLLDWLPPVLHAWSNLDLPAENGDLAQRWNFRTEAVQQLLDDSNTADAVLSNGPFAGGTVGGVIDQIYTADIYQHTWDLAKSTGQNPQMDPDIARNMLSGMRQMEEALRSSGQYGPAIPTASTDPVEQLVAFIGRDPQWQSPPTEG